VELLDLLPGFTCVHYPVPSPGLKGQGVAIFIHNTIQDHVTLWKSSPHVQALWLRINKCVFGSASDVLFGAVYIPPENTNKTSRVDEILQAYISLSADIQDATAQGLLPYLSGDFNVKLPALSEFLNDHPHLTCRFPELALPRTLSGIALLNTSGNALLDMAVVSGHICTTGRGRGDTGQPTCRTATRTEHLLLDPDLYALLKTTSFPPDFVCSDHVPMTHTFQTSGSLNHNSLLEGHKCGPECLTRARCERTLRWDPSKAAEYCEHLQSQASFFFLV
jgi:hypothetical protein